MRKTIFIRCLKVMAIIAIIALVFGSIRQYLFDLKVKNEFIPKGKFVNTSQGKIHYSLIGSGDYTFVMEAGLGETMETWHLIKDSLSQMGRVFMYDRAGLGFSTESDLPRTSEAIANQLSEVLQNAKIPGPYILVGHSIGGLHVRSFANKFPEDVIGLFLLDPSHEDIPEDSKKPTLVKSLFYYTMTDLYWTGIPFYGISKRIDPTYRNSKNIRTYGKEYKGIAMSIKEFKTNPYDISNFPIYVISAQSDSEKLESFYIELYEKLIDHSKHSVKKLIEYKVPHNIHLSDPDLVIKDLKLFLSEISSYKVNKNANSIKN